MHQIDIAATAGHQQHADGQRQQVEGGKARVFLDLGKARRQPGKTGHQHAGDKAAEAHRVADQAHAPHHQEQADRRAAQRQRQARHQRTAHEGEFDKGCQHPLVQEIDH
ncbi:hypothetical protein D3C72_1895470 [compost metagenome]